MSTPLIDIPIDWDPQAKQQPTGLIACGINAAALFEVPSLAQKEKPAHNVYWFLVRVVIQNFSKTIVVQFVFEVIG